MGDLERPPINNVISFGPFCLMPSERLLKRENEPILLGSRALDILLVLIERAGEVVPRKELISRVWPDVTVDDANLRVHISSLRRVLGDGCEGARYVVNVPGHGYCFVAPLSCSTTQTPSPATRTTISDRIPTLPARLTRLVGRDDTVRILSAQLMTHRLVSIVGSGGIGKTAVAVSVAYALTDGFEGEVFFVDLGSVTDPLLVPAAVTSVLGLKVQTRDPLGSLLAWIRHKKVLLVLDNCEHVIEAAAALVERIVTEAARAHVLVTSREALRAESEVVQPLYAFDCPPENASLTAAEALTYPSVQLFMERATAGGYGSKLSDADAVIIARICRSLDGIALAIELAASRAASLGIRGTADLLGSRLKLLWRGRRAASPRHQTLSAMLDWSYNLLSEHEKAVLRRLSVFVGGFTLQAACDVALEERLDDPDIADTVASLVAKSWISVTIIDGSTYYRLLETTRSYAIDKLVRSGESEKIARRHAESCCRLLQQNTSLEAGLPQYEYSRSAIHLGNVRAALEWSMSDDGDKAIGVDLAAGAMPLFVRSSMLEECRRWCEWALKALGETRRGSRQEMSLHEALALALMCTTGFSQEVCTAIERGLAIAATLEDWQRQLRLLASLNIFLLRVGDFSGAAAVAKQCHAIAQNALDSTGLMTAEWMLAACCHFGGNQAAAQLHCETTAAYVVELDCSDTEYSIFYRRADGLTILARTLWLRGFPDRAREVAQKAIEEEGARDHPACICFTLGFGLPVFLWTGDFAKAGYLIERLVAHAVRYSLEPYRALGMALKGELAIRCDKQEIGLDLLLSALKVLHAARDNVLTAFFAGVLAEGFRKVGQFQEALVTIDRAIASSKRHGGTFGLAELLRTKAEILMSVPEPDHHSALDCLREGLAVAREQSALALELRSATVLARLLSDSGQHDLARNALTSVYDRFTEGFETTDLRSARRLIDELA